MPDSIIGKVPSWAISGESLWVGISGRARAVVYNTKNVDPAELPTTLEGFTDPKWKGRIGWAPTNGSFQAFVTAMRIHHGEDIAKEWLLGIIANDPKVYPKNTPIVAAAAAGEIDIGFVNHYYLYKFVLDKGKGDQFKARNVGNYISWIKLPMNTLKIGTYTISLGCSRPIDREDFGTYQDVIKFEIISNCVKSNSKSAAGRLFYFLQM